MPDKKFIKEKVGKISFECYQEVPLADFCKNFYNQTDKILRDCEAKGYINTTISEPHWSEIYNECGHATFLSVHAERLETDEEYDRRQKRSAQAKASARKRNQKKKEQEYQKYLQLKKQYES